MKKKQQYSLRYAKEQLLKKFEREGVTVAVGIAKDTLQVRLYKEEDRKKIPEKYYGYRVEIRFIGGVSVQ